MEKAINLKITLPMKAQPKHSLTKVFLQTAKLEVHIENILSYKIALPTKSRRKHPKKSEFSSTLGKSTSKLKKKKKRALCNITVPTKALPKNFYFLSCYQNLGPKHATVSEFKPSHTCKTKLFFKNEKRTP